MKFFSLKEAQDELSSLVLHEKKEPIVITKRGKPEAVLISLEQFEQFLDALEELEDIEAAEIVTKSNDPTIPWEKVKKELRLS